MGRAKISAAWRGNMLTESHAKEKKTLRPAVFLDRDGTIIDDIGYLADPAGISFYPGVPEALKRLQDRGYLLVVITNQSGIGRGFFDEETALAVNLTMLKNLREKGVVPAAIYYCPHHSEDNCRCRKPDLLMVERALGDLGIDSSRSWMVGDIDKDVQTAINAGFRPILVETGKVEKGDVPLDVKRCETVVEAVEFILNEDTL
jgi:D-glycero-D-manno-heptose 1,7-bisphosphate phosphatase